MTVRLSASRKSKRVKQLGSKNHADVLEESTSEHKVNAIELALQKEDVDGVVKAGLVFAKRMAGHGGLSRDGDRLMLDLVHVGYVAKEPQLKRASYEAVICRCCDIAREGRGVLYNEDPLDRAILRWIGRETQDVGGADDLHWASMVACCAVEQIRKLM